jgi:hypothetical protein
MLQNVKRVYMLGTYTVERRQTGWWYWPSYGEKKEAKGPYSNMASVTLMIARHLKRELVKRDGDE